MPQPSILYATGRVWAMMDHLLNQERMTRMLEAPDAAEVLRQLADTEYGPLAAEIDSTAYETMLQQETARVWALVASLFSDERLVDVFALQNDAHNLKVLYKARILNRDYDALLQPGSISIDALKAFVRDGDTVMLPDRYREALRVMGKELAEPTPMQAAIAADRWYFATALWLLADKTYDLVRPLIQAKLDFANICTLLRVKAMQGDEAQLSACWIPGGTLDGRLPAKLSDTLESLLETLRQDTAGTLWSDALAEGLADYARTHSTAGLEKRMDDWQLAYVAKHRNEAGSCMPLIGYLFAKEREIANLRLILTAKQGGVSAEGVRERLRGVYV